MCEHGKKIVARDGAVCVLANGDVTVLYWHSYYCDACALAREEQK